MSTSDLSNIFCHLKKKARLIEVTELDREKKLKQLYSKRKLFTMSNWVDSDCYLIILTVKLWKI